MKNMDFKQIKSIKTPESWIENAINIPKKNKKPTLIYLKPYLIASVASLVLCCTLCLTVFFSINNNATVPVAPNTTQSTLQTATDTTDKTQQTETTTILPTLIVPIPTDVVQGNTSPVINAIESTTQVKPQSPTIALVTEPSEKTTESVIVTEPTQTTKPVEPTEPTETTIQTEPTEFSTEPPVIEPPTALPSEPMITEPMMTESVAQNPTTPGGLPPIETYVTIYFTNVESRGFCRSDELYCHIETLSGESSTEKFTESEKAYWNNYSGYVFYQAKLNRYTQYYITFYDKYGNSYTADIYYCGGNINI